MLFLWIFLYGLVYTLSRAAAPFTGNSPWPTPLAMLGYILLLLIWLVHTNRQKNLGLSPVKPHAKNDPGYFLPLLMIPALNLSGISEAPPLPYILLMFGTCFAEELLFRGWLLSFLVRRLGKWGIVCSALAFSVLHSANLLSGTEIRYVLAQMLLAFFAGIYYGLIRIRFKSLYPCIVAHFLTNITAHSADVCSAPYLIAAALLGICGWNLYSKLSSELEDIS